MFLFSGIFYANVGVLSYFQALLQFLWGAILLEDKRPGNVRDFTLPPLSRWDLKSYGLLAAYSTAP